MLNNNVYNLNKANAKINNKAKLKQSIINTTILMSKQHIKMC